MIYILFMINIFNHLIINLINHTEIMYIDKGTHTHTHNTQTMMIYTVYNDMYISLLQIQFNPLHQYAYVPVPRSHKIEGKSLSVMNDYRRLKVWPADWQLLLHRRVSVNGAEGEDDRAGRCATSTRESSQQILRPEGDEGDGQLSVPRTRQPLPDRSLWPQQPTVQQQKGVYLCMQGYWGLGVEELVDIFFAWSSCFQKLG